MCFGRPHRVLCYDTFAGILGLKPLMIESRIGATTNEKAPTILQIDGAFVVDR